MTNVPYATAVAAIVSLLACSSDKGVTDPGGNPTTINWAPCINDFDSPSWFAVQDGTKAWTQVTPQSGVFSFKVASDKIGVAIFANGLLSITYATPAEIQGLASTCGTARRVVNGTVTGYASPDEIAIQADQGSASIAGAQTAPASFALSDVTPAAFDVLAVRSRSTVTGPTFQRTPSSVFIRRAQNTSTLALIDLNSTTEAGAPLAQTATLQNVAVGESIVAVASLNTPSTSIDMGFYSTTLATVSGGVTAPFFGLPSARLIAGESQTLDVSATKAVSSTVNESRYVTLNYPASADKTAALGPALATVAIAGGTRTSATYALQTGYDQTFELDVDQGSTRSIQVIMTRSYAGAAAAQVTVQVPDLSRVAGFQPSWSLTAGSSATWTFFAAGASIAVFRHNDQSYAAASRTSTFTP